MATEEHLKLSLFIKNVHESLRNRAKIVGPDSAWEEHKQNSSTLKTYSEAMTTLADIWEKNIPAQSKSVKSRILWVFNFCLEYFFSSEIYKQKRTKELHIMETIGINEPDFNVSQQLLDKLETINVLDVGSCFNPFKSFPNFEVTAIDLFPANDSVYKCDFLEVKLTDNENDDFPPNKAMEILTLRSNFFHCVVFSLLLEYIPSSKQRIDCCKKAYNLLKPEGILLIITPDSQHVGKNAKLMKNWRYTLAVLGFSRIKFEKLEHITCMGFRKSISSKINHRWADLHKENYMTFSLDIPQDEKNS